jgi:hypothetical protein
MKRVIAMLTVAAASLFGTFGVLPEWASPAEAHDTSTILAICQWFDAATFGPENNGIYIYRYRSVHYGHHFANCCYYNLSDPFKAQMYYDINTGAVNWNVHEGPGGWCPNS